MGLNNECSNEDNKSADMTKLKETIPSQSPQKSSKDLVQNVSQTSNTEIANEFQEYVQDSSWNARQNKKHANVQLSESKNITITSKEIDIVHSNQADVSSVRNPFGSEQKTPPTFHNDASTCPPLIPRPRSSGQMLDTNVNKQQICLSEKLQTMPSREIEGSMVLDDVQSTFNYKPKQNIHEFPLHQNDIINDSKITHSVVEQKCIGETKNVKVIEYSVDDGNMETSYNDEISLWNSAADVSLRAETQNDVNNISFTVEDKLRTEISHYLSEKNFSEPTEALIDPSVTQKSQSSELCTQYKQENIQELSCGENGTMLFALPEKNQNLVVLKGRRRPGGIIKLHQPYSCILDDSKVSDNVTLVSPSRNDNMLFQLSSSDLPYDDSIFPTRHTLETSEDLRAAMMQARIRKSYRRLEPIVRIPYAVRDDLKSKYRQVMAETHRRSFNQWKADISARDCHEKEILKNGQSPAYSSPMRVYPVGCPTCLQYNMSNIYGKPCFCRKVIKSEVLVRKSKTEKPKKDLQRNTITTNKPYDTEPVTKHSEQTQADVMVPSKLDLMHGSQCGVTYPSHHYEDRPSQNSGTHSSTSSDRYLRESGKVRVSPCASNEEDSLFRNLVTSRILADPISTFTGQVTKDSSAIKATPGLDVCCSRTTSDPDTTSDNENHRTAQSVSRASSRITKSSFKTISSSEDLTTTNPSSSTCEPLRKWEIANLEKALKKCIIRTDKISKSLKGISDSPYF